MKQALPKYMGMRMGWDRPHVTESRAALSSRPLRVSKKLSDMKALGYIIAGCICGLDTQRHGQRGLKNPLQVRAFVKSLFALSHKSARDRFYAQMLQMRDDARDRPLRFLNDRPEAFG